MASCNLCGVEMVGGCAAKGCPHRAPQPSVPSGEAVRNALRRVLDNADWDDLADLANAMTGQRDVNTHEMADALLAAPPQERVSEAKVRGELQSVVDANASAALRMCRERDEAKSRAERAEADANEVREAFKRVSMEMDRAERRQREMGEHGKRWEERARKAEAALADAKREGAYEALTKFEERVGWYPGCLATLGNIRAFRDSLYAIRVSCDLRKTLDDARAPQGRTE